LLLLSSQKNKKKKKKKKKKKNITLTAHEKVKGCKSPFELMKKLRKEYDKKESSDIRYWLYQMYSLKSKNINDSMAVIMRIEEILICLIINATKTNYSKQIWYQRLGHLYHEDLEKYLNRKITKLKRKLHNENPTKTSRILETIHSDLMGSINKSVNGKAIFLLS